jgi:hypothetical protein
MCAGRLQSLSATRALRSHPFARGRLTPGARRSPLVDDARTATPPPATDERVATPPPTADSRTVTPLRGDEAGAGGALGDVGTSASPRIINVDPISARPGGVDEDLVRDQAQIDQVPQGSGTSGAQVPDSSPSSPRLPLREIDWNDTPW